MCDMVRFVTNATPAGYPAYQQPELHGVAYEKASGTKQDRIGFRHVIVHL
jgi:hypothetical protein